MADKFNVCLQEADKLHIFGFCSCFCACFPVSILCFHSFRFPLALRACNPVSIGRAGQGDHPTPGGEGGGCGRPFNPLTTEKIKKSPSAGPVCDIGQPPTKNRSWETQLTPSKFPRKNKKAWQCVTLSKTKKRNEKLQLWPIYERTMSKLWKRADDRSTVTLLSHPLSHPKNTSIYYIFSISMTIVTIKYSIYLIIKKVFIYKL